MSKDQYFAAQEPEECAAVLMHKMDMWSTNLEANGLIKPVSSHEYALTSKAKWERIYKHPSWGFWAFIIAILTLIISIIIA